MFKQISHYSVSTVVAGIATLISIPFFTRVLSPEDFGVLALYTMFGGITSNILSVGLYTATSRYYFKEINNPEYFARLNFTNIIFIVFMYLIGGFFVWKFANDISYYLFDNKLSNEIVLLSYLGGCLGNIYAYLSGLLISQERSIIYSFSHISVTIGSIIIAIILIMFFSLTYHARIYSWIFNHLILIIILIYLQRNYFIPILSINCLKRSLTFSYPQIPAKMTGLIQQGLDKVMLTNYKSLDQVGIYQIALRFGEINKLLMNSVMQGWNPYFMSKSELKTSEAKLDIVKRYQEIVMLFNFASITVCMFGEELIRLLTTKQFYNSMYILPIIIIYILFNHSLNAIAKPQIIFSEKMVYILPSSIASVLVNIIFNIILIPMYGAIGAAIATLFAGLTSSTILFYFGNKLYPLPLYFSRLVGQFILFIIFLIPIYGFMFIEMHILLKLFVKIIVLIIYLWLAIKIKLININTILLVLNKIGFQLKEKNEK
ncbi:oligosaccharide flippase family protein [Candidatus Marinimicrobia bacterium]|nr:oligosaccharide flippase family protein [Candidatus Neomarinimicrobiota bacterium]